MNENELCSMKEYKVDSPLITEIYSIIDNFYKDCHNIYFQEFKNECIFDIKTYKYL